MTEPVRAWWLLILPTLIIGPSNPFNTCKEETK